MAAAWQDVAAVVAARSGGGAPLVGDLAVVDVGGNWCPGAGDGVQLACARVKGSRASVPPE